MAASKTESYVGLSKGHCPVNVLEVQLAGILGSEGWEGLRDKPGEGFRKAFL